ncbi:hypothetical protein [Streptomyces sp. NPDC002537]
MNMRSLAASAALTACTAIALVIEATGSAQAAPNFATKAQCVSGGGFAVLGPEGFQHFDGLYDGEPVMG